MEIIDSHCHTSPIWFEPIGTLKNQMKDNNVKKAVLVQFFGVYDNDYLIEQMENFPNMFKVAALVDVTSVDASETLQNLADRGVNSVRFTANTRSPGSDPLEIWKTAEKLNLIATVLGTCEDYASDSFERLIRNVPSLPIVIEHLGGVGAFFGPGRTTPVIPQKAYDKVLALNKYENTYMKITGFGEFCERPRPMPSGTPFTVIPPVLDQALEAYGSKRLFWGSDYPPVSAREGYGNAFSVPYNYLKISQSEKDDIFGTNALTLWKFKKGD
ncbi:MAG TPA: hypothetical protein DEZ08_00945 [Dehalococcoidia bacterium]|nr:hypothetical protein [Dehalococcoidia bacterium]